jgi:hypothetical protein
MIKINQPDNASILTGILPVTNEPLNKYSESTPASARKAMKLLRVAIMVTVATVIIPFHCTLTNGITTIAERIIIMNAVIIAIR